MGMTEFAGTRPSSSLAPQAAAPTIEPTRFGPAQKPLRTFETINAMDHDVPPVKLQADDGSLRPVDAWREELSSDPQTAILQVARALRHNDSTPYQYKPYGSDLSEVRPPINEGLERGGAECDWFASVGYYALSERLGRENVRVASVHPLRTQHEEIARDLRYREHGIQEHPLRNDQQATWCRSNDPGRNRVAVRNGRFSD